MRHMLRQFGPCLKWPWTHLEAPELTEQLIDRMVEGTQAQAADARFANSNGCAMTAWWRSSRS